jgi:peptidoglycan/LPS O-acetylase OafA/YrhL
MALWFPFDLKRLGINFWTTEPRYHRIPSESTFLEQGIHDDIGTTPLQSKWYQRTPRLEWLWCMAPWFLASAFGKTDRQLPKKSSTSYLNGIRGVACLIVFSDHVTDRYYNSRFKPPYGANPAEQNHAISQLPILHIIYAGTPMVCIFFVLSGFVLAYSPLRKVNAPSQLSDRELNTGLCSSILRRAIRLFMPLVILAILTCFVTWIYPTFRPGDWRRDDPSFLQHAWRFVEITMPLFNPFSWELYQPLSFEHCWSIAAEYRGSMVIFLVCIATSRLTTRARKVVVSCLALWAMYLGRSDIFCFLSGMVLAELRFFPLTQDIPFMKEANIYRHVSYSLATCLLLFSLLLLGWPDTGDAGVEPFKSLVTLTPAIYMVNTTQETFFWGSVGAVGFMIAVENLPPVQWLFSTVPLLYLGEISFSFYLLHWMAFLWPGMEMMRYFMLALGWTWNFSFYCMVFTILALLVVCSDYYWRGVDQKCVEMGKVVVNWLGVHESDAPKVTVNVKADPHVVMEDCTVPIVDPEPVDIHIKEEVIIIL